VRNAQAPQGRRRQRRAFGDQPQNMGRPGPPAGRAIFASVLGLVAERRRWRGGTGACPRWFGLQTLRGAPPLSLCQAPKRLGRGAPAARFGTWQGLGRFAERLAATSLNPRRGAPQATPRPGAAVAPEPGEGWGLLLLFRGSAADAARRSLRVVSVTRCNDWLQ